MPPDSDLSLGLDDSNDLDANDDSRPDGCPVDQPFSDGSPSDEDIVDLAVSIEGHQENLRAALARDPHAAHRVAIGQSACSSCGYREQCESRFSTAKNSGLVDGAVPPSKLPEVLSKEDLISIWAHAAVNAQVDRGYSPQSAAGVAAAIGKLPPLLQGIAVGALRINMGALPLRIESFRTPEGSEYFSISWDSSRLIISEQALGEIDLAMRGNPGQTGTFMHNLATSLTPNPGLKDPPLKELLKIGRPPKWIRKIQGWDIFEFNSTTRSTLRAFGDIIDTVRSDGQRVVTVVISGASHKAKSGSARRSTSTPAAAAKKSLDQLTSALGQPEGSSGVSRVWGASLRRRVVQTLDTPLPT